MVTKSDGYVRYHAKFKKQNKLTQSYLADHENTLIPIKINTIEKGFSHNLIFWFLPTQILLENMPDRYKLEIQSDIENIENEMNTKAFKANTSCTYFEVCRSTLKLDEMKVYPNPASSTIAFDFVTSQALEGKISLVNIAGQELKVLQTNTKFVVGVNHLSV